MDFNIIYKTSRSATLEIINNDILIPKICKFRFIPVSDLTEIVQTELRIFPSLFLWQGIRKRCSKSSASREQSIE